MFPKVKMFPLLRQNLLKKKPRLLWHTVYSNSIKYLVNSSVTECFSSRLLINIMRLIQNKRRYNEFIGAMAQRSRGSFKKCHRQIKNIQNFIENRKKDKPLKFCVFLGVFLVIVTSTAEKDNLIIMFVNMFLFCAFTNVFFLFCFFTT